MKKIISLIKVSLNHDLNIFNINTKKQSKTLKVLLPLIITIYFMFMLIGYSWMLISELEPMHLEFALLTLFALGVSILSLVEGIYKSGSLLFNCKDDNLLLSLPIKKKTVLYIRIFKFYIFELLYNSLFILPAIIVYAIKVMPGITYYISSFFALLILPIIPIILSCIIGFIITYLSSKFKGKNILQTIITTLFLLVIMYIGFNSNNLVTNIASKASSINDFIVRLYYPVGEYISLITDFKITNLIIYILIHLIIIVIALFVLGKFYFKINSNSKKVISSNKNKKYIIKTNSMRKSFVKKELNKFFRTPVFITNAGFGLVLFVISCILITIKFDSIASGIVSIDASLTIEKINDHLPVIMLGIVCFGSFMTSITSSMISLEGKTINLLKSLPITPLKISLYKVLTSLIIMIPCLIIGDIIVFIRFKFDIISIILILIASILFPLVSELIGIIINLKYPKTDASNDTEVVKQSMSSLISTFAGLGLVGLTLILLFALLDKLNNNIIMLIFIVFYGIICFGLWLILKKNCNKYFNNING